MKTHIHEHQRSSKLGAALVSMLVNLFLIALKVIVGVLTGSIGILAEAAHSLLDLVASLLAFLGIHWADRPADSSHAFGHEKFENLSSGLQMLMLGGTCAVILYEAIKRMVTGFTIDVTWYALAVMAIAVALDFFISRYLHQTAHHAGGSVALEADALHFISDMWGAVAVIAGLALARAGLRIADPVAAIIVALVIGGTAVKSGLKTTAILMDQSPEQATLDRVGQIVKNHPEIINFHTLRARQAGSRVLLDVCIELDENTGLGRAHQISHEVSERIKQQIPEVADALVHAEPACRIEPHDEHNHPGH
ncbi:MAG: cation diffusion facilitator family transporter [Actinobacteria bacterium]|nr:cation diffusion facilitator family transporter [Actinomycetota bacterium]